MNRHIEDLLEILKVASPADTVVGRSGDDADFLVWKLGAKRSALMIDDDVARILLGLGAHAESCG